MVQPARSFSVACIACALALSVASAAAHPGPPTMREHLVRRAKAYAIGLVVKHRAQREIKKYVAEHPPLAPVYAEARHEAGVVPKFAMMLGGLATSTVLDVMSLFHPWLFVPKFAMNGVNFLLNRKWAAARRDSNTVTVSEGQRLSTTDPSLAVEPKVLRRWERRKAINKLAPETPAPAAVIH
jgi:hypothetical protein